MKHSMLESRAKLAGSVVGGVSLILAAGSASAVVSAFQNSSDLDLDGTFAYAINFGTGDVDTDVDGLIFNPVGDGNTVAGVSTTPDPIRTFGGPLGPVTEGFWNVTPALGGDDDINTVLSSLIDAHDTSAGVDSFEVDLDAVDGQAYRLQLILNEEFFQSDASRVFDISVDGVLVADDLDPYKVAVTDSGTAEGDSAVLVSYDFVGDGTVDIEFTNETSFAILSGLTLEVVPEPASVGLLAIGGLAIFGRRHH